MSGPRDRGGTGTVFLVLAGLAITLVGIVWAEAVSSAGGSALDAAEPLFVGLERLGGSIHHRGAALVAVIRLPAVLMILLWRSVGTWFGRTRSPLMIRLAGLGLAGAAHSWATDGMLLAAIGIYGMAIVLYVSAGAPPRLQSGGWSITIASLLALVAFLAAGLYRLDVHPDLYVDERAYLLAARMQLGELPRGDLPIGFAGKSMYIFERFEAQAIPLGLHSVAIDLGSPGVLPIRFVSLIAMIAALLIVYVISGSRLGAAAGLVMIAFAASSPFTLAYARVGLYIAVSVLHGTACVALLLWLAKRWSAPAAGLLGLALGSASFLYQVSWFCPILIAGAVALCPEIWRREGFFPKVALVLLVASLVAASGPVLFPAGWQQVWAQSIDKVRGGGDERGWSAASLLATSSATPTPALPSAGDTGLVTQSFTSSRGHRVLLAVGPRAEVARLVRSQPADGWLLLEQWGERLDGVSSLRSIRSSLRSVRTMLARLFEGRPGWESSGRLVDTGLANPLLVPFFLVGLVAAVRRWRDPYVRILLVWTVLGGLLPVAVAGTLPRRSVLALPFAHVVAALPAVELAASASRRASKILFAAGTSFAILAFGLGVHLYSSHWDIALSNRPHRGGHLELAKVLRGLSSKEPVFVSASLPGLRSYLDSVEEMDLDASGRGVTLVDTAQIDRVAERIACRQAPPFAWVAFDDESGLALQRRLSKFFRLMSDSQEGFQILRLEARRIGACRGADTPRR